MPSAGCPGRRRQRSRKRTRSGRTPARPPCAGPAGNTACGPAAAGRTTRRLAAGVGEGALLQHEPLVLQDRHADRDLAGARRWPRPAPRLRGPRCPGGPAARQRPPPPGGTSSAPCTTTAAWSSASAVHHSSIAPVSWLRTRFRSARASNSPRHSSRAGVTTRVPSRSWSSSAERGAGAPRPPPGRWPRGRGARWCRARPAGPGAGHRVGAAVDLAVVEEGRAWPSGSRGRTPTPRWCPGSGPELRPVSTPSSRSVRPSMSRPSVRVSCTVWRTSG